MEELNEVMENTTAETTQNDFGAVDYNIDSVEGSHPNYALIAGGVAAGAAAIGGIVAVAKKVKAKRAEKGESDNVKTRKRLCIRNPFFVKEEAIVDITDVQADSTPEPTPEATQQ